MNIRKRVQKSAKALLEAETPRHVTLVVAAHLHTIPGWAISRALKQIPPASLAKLAPYILPRAYPSLPLEYIMYPALRPLISPRVLKRAAMLPRTDERAQLAKTRQWNDACALHAADSELEVMLRQAITGTSIRVLHRLVDMAMTNEFVCRTVVSVLGDAALHAVDHRRIIALLQAYPAAVTSNLFFRYTHPHAPGHYAIIAHILRRLVADEQADKVFKDFGCMRMLHQGGLIYRMPADLRAWLAAYIRRRWPGKRPVWLAAKK